MRLTKCCQTRRNGKNTTASGPNGSSSPKAAAVRERELRQDIQDLRRRLGVRIGRQ
jgi:hypothetical protein